MPDLPYVVLSCAASVDGYIDDTSRQRLLLSNDEDVDRVDALRADCDAILVGANTLRRDNPRLVVRSGARRAERVRRGRPPLPLKATLTASGELPPEAAFFTVGAVEKVVYTASRSAAVCRDRLGTVATVVDAGDPVDLRTVLRDLAARGVRRLLVEGGQDVHTQFSTAGLVDEIQLTIAPFFVGDPAAPRFVGPGRFPHDRGNRMRLIEVRPVGDQVLLRYATRRPSPGTRAHRQL